MHICTRTLSETSLVLRTPTFVSAEVLAHSIQHIESRMHCYVLSLHLTPELFLSYGLSVYGALSACATTFTLPTPFAMVSRPSITLCYVPVS